MIPEKRPKTVKEMELRFFWNRNQHSPSTKRALGVMRNLETLEMTGAETFNCSGPYIPAAILLFVNVAE